jgi:hypothetical protein
VAGYQWDDMLATMKGAFLVCPQGAQNEWWVEMSMAKAKVVKMTPAKQTEQTRRVTPKIAKKERTGEEPNA